MLTEEDPDVRRLPRKCGQASTNESTQTQREPLVMPSSQFRPLFTAMNESLTADELGNLRSGGGVQVTATSHPRPCAHKVPILGGGPSAQMYGGRLAGLVESRHLVLRRLMRSRAVVTGREFLDVGTDSTYPFFDGYGPTETALKAVAASVRYARVYPSSYGLIELREEMAALLRRQFGVDVDPMTEMMITAGASQAFDALSRGYVGRYVLLPELALSTVESISVGNGAIPIRIPLDENYRIDLNALKRTIATYTQDGIRFLYLNSPTNPSGVLYGRESLTEIVETACAHCVLVVHDHDSWFTTHCNERSVNILEVPRAKEVAVTVLSVSKELGLPGLRIGAVVGCPEVINVLRIHNSQFSVMIPEFCQHAAALALRAFRDDAARRRVQQEIHNALEAAFAGLRALGWPEEAILSPSAGYKFLFRPPPSFAFAGDPSGVELFDFLIARDAAVKFSTSRSFNADDHSWIRMILMQRPDRINELFARLNEIGVCYQMSVPRGLREDYEAVMACCDLSNL
jgi:aspartate/methionine/tyrosine aminotransferase